MPDNIREASKPINTHIAGSQRLWRHALERLIHPESAKSVVLAIAPHMALLGEHQMVDLIESEDVSFHGNLSEGTTADFIERTSRCRIGASSYERRMALVPIKEAPSDKLLE